MATGTVTLDKVYFETLLRKAQFHSGAVDYTTPLNVTTVAIPKADHDSLLTTARQHANLQRNLFRGGIAEETLAILIKDDGPPADGTTTYSAADEPAESTGFLTQHPPASTFPGTNGQGQNFAFGRNIHNGVRGDHGTQGNGSHGNGNGFKNGFSNGFHLHSQHDDFADGPDGFFDENENTASHSRAQRQQFAKFAKRSILLSNLPDGTTHSDITSAVRGGMLLDVYLRSNDRCVQVSFLEEAAAQDFFQFVKRHDLYIRGKRVEIRWSDRHFILPGHVANKIHIGATRNLVIQNCSPKHTEEQIRDDLEHIHNLVVVDVAFKGQNAYISTNSVHNSMFARTCMMSRAKYKGSKIEWSDDECAAPIARPLGRKENSLMKKKPEALVNRFHLLNMDDDESTEDDEQDSSGITLSDAVLPGPRYG